MSAALTLVDSVVIGHARREAAAAIAPIVARRSAIEQALELLDCDDDAMLHTVRDTLRDRIAELDDDVATALRTFALRHRLFVREDETEVFDDVDTDAITPPSELARIRWTSARKGR